VLLAYKYLYGNTGSHTDSERSSHGTMRFDLLLLLDFMSLFFPF